MHNLLRMEEETYFAGQVKAILFENNWEWNHNDQKKTLRLEAVVDGWDHIRIVISLI